jgi:hypothetical protein
VFVEGVQFLGRDPVLLEVTAPGELRSELGEVDGVDVEAGHVADGAVGRVLGVPLPSDERGVLEVWSRGRRSAASPAEAEMPASPTLR